MEDVNKDLIADEDLLDELVENGKEEKVAQILSEFDEIEPPEEEDGYDAIAHEE